MPINLRRSRREKVFGPGRAVPLDRNAKCRIAAYAKAWSARNRQPRHDPGDNTPLSSLLGADSCSLFPVINMTLNITAGTNTAWAERKAASFTATPLVCGSAALHHPSQRATAIDPDGAFVPTDRFAGLENASDQRRRPR
jgi:hypothetical protein